MREWGSDPESGGFGSEGSAEEFFSQLFSQDLSSAVEVAGRFGLEDHPPEEVLRAYAAGRLAPDWPDPEELQQGAWGYRKVSVHVLRCGRCRAQLRALLAAPVEARARVPASSTEWGAFRWLRRWLQEAAQPVPRPALATIAVQSLVIVGLVGLLLWQPEPLFHPSPGVDTLNLRPLPSVDSDTDTGSASSSSSSSNSDSGFSLQPTAPAPEAPALGETPEGTSEEPLADLPLPEEASYPPEVRRAIETVQTVPDPNARLSALKLLQRYPDPLLVEHLSQLYEREEHPQVREEMARTIALIISRTDRGLSQVVRILPKLRQHTPQIPWLRQIERDLAELQKRLSESFQITVEIRYPQTLRCTARADLTLGQLMMIVSDLDGTIVLDRSLTTRRFRMQLPLSATERVEALQRLEGLGIVCEE